MLKKTFKFPQKTSEHDKIELQMQPIKQKYKLMRDTLLQDFDLAVKPYVLPVAHGIGSWKTMHTAFSQMYKDYCNNLSRIATQEIAELQPLTDKYSNTPYNMIDVVLPVDAE